MDGWMEDGSLQHYYNSYICNESLIYKGIYNILIISSDEKLGKYIYKRLRAKVGYVSTFPSLPITHDILNREIY